jgi:peptidoglycan/xylan/chitin deacetylase (PgdA/CDA1 family)
MEAFAMMPPKAQRGAWSLDTLLGRYRAAEVWPRGVVSFTFDDFPKTALQAGGLVLERHGLRGTYYVSAGLAGTEGEVGRFFDPEDLAECHGRGHEIACHTYSHLRCSEAAREAMVKETEVNGAALAALVEGLVPTNFAYPYGAVSPLAKRTLKPRFQSCRGVRPGINSGVLDLGELLANSVYSRTFEEARMRRLIDENADLGGWLIFYTHDVEASPSPYGCTVEQWESLVGYAAAKGAVLPMKDVVDGLGVKAPSRTRATA